MASNQRIEEYPYEVINTYQSFEVRQYEEALFTSIRLNSTSYKQGSSKGFSILANYIFGGNDRKQRIAMTSPVTMTLEDNMRVMFMIPNSLERDDMPLPNDRLIDFILEPKKTLAVVTFGGWASDKKIAKYKSRLTEALSNEGIQHENKFFVFGYNPPYEIFNRRNEVAVEILYDSVESENSTQMNSSNRKR
ncbi:heme-binding protein [Schleiferiaceae bacterium]|nr:heme-binding protein [Schleiferiaceae bacterium]